MKASTLTHEEGNSFHTDVRLLQNFCLVESSIKTTKATRDIEARASILSPLSAKFCLYLSTRACMHLRLLCSMLSHLVSLATALEPSFMQCRERPALLKIYRERVKAFSNAVESLKKYRASLSPGEFKQRWSLADFAREACSVAQRRVCSHVAVHIHFRRERYDKADGGLRTGFCFDPIVFST